MTLFERCAFVCFENGIIIENTELNAHATTVLNPSERALASICLHWRKNLYLLRKYAKNIKYKRLIDQKLHYDRELTPTDNLLLKHSDSYQRDFNKKAYEDPTVENIFHLIETTNTSYEIFYQLSPNKLSAIDLTLMCSMYGFSPSDQLIGRILNLQLYDIIRDGIRRQTITQRSIFRTAGHYLGFNEAKTHIEILRDQFIPRCSFKSVFSPIGFNLTLLRYLIDEKFIDYEKSIISAVRDDMLSYNMVSRLMNFGYLFNPKTVIGVIHKNLSHAIKSHKVSLMMNGMIRLKEILTRHKFSNPKYIKFLDDDVEILKKEIVKRQEQPFPGVLR